MSPVAAHLRELRAADGLYCSPDAAGREATSDSARESLTDCPIGSAMDHLIAHSAGPDGRPQPLREHLGEVADRATQFAAPFDSEAFAGWLGWWHDAGKAPEDVQDYLKGRTDAERGPDHSSIGMLKALEVLHPLAFNIAGHHGGLADKADLRRRIQRKKGEPRIRKALALAEELLGSIPEPRKEDLPAFLKEADGPERNRRFTFWLRMLHSCLVDADCLDTEAHFDPERAELRGGEQVIEPGHWEAFERDQRHLIEGAAETPVNAARQRIYRNCLEAAELEPGIFSLTVPTGGGKTRSSIAFALRHALRYGKRRAIVTLPYTSIIEQNAEVYRDIFGAESVLEHHSSVRREANLRERPDVERWRRLAAQNWNAPIVVTTTVQLLESLFANQNRRCRKLHRLAESVIILDEVQTLPPKLLRPTLEALQHLVDHYGATLLLSTATQPAFRSRRDFEGLSGVREIIDEPKTLYRALRRVEYDLRDEPMTWAEVAGEMQEAEQALAVCNTTRDAHALFATLPNAPHVFHLSARMCPAHRQHVLKRVRARLAGDQPVLLASTQCIECGVNVDFPRAFRALGPFDSIVQAAGRCNREGRQESYGLVTVFEPAEGSPLPPEAYRTGTDETRILLNRPGGLDFHSPVSSILYFRELYRSSSTDARSVQEKLAGYQFKEVARAYRLIPDDTVPVVVPYPPAQPKIDAALERVQSQGQPLRRDWQALQPYTVNVPVYRLDDAAEDGDCQEIAPDLWLWEGIYDREAGLYYRDELSQTT